MDNPLWGKFQDRNSISKEETMNRLTGAAAIARLKEMDLSGWIVIDNLNNVNSVGRLNTDDLNRFWLYISSSETYCLIPGEVEIVGSSIVFFHRVVGNAISFKLPEGVHQLTFVHTA